MTTTATGELTVRQTTTPVQGQYPLTTYQRDIWSIAELFPESSSYVTAIAAHLVGDVDEEVLARCYARVWKRNDGMRLRFGMTDGRPYQELSDDDPSVERRDVTGEPDPTAAARELMRATVDTPIDLTAGVPLRLMLIRDGMASVQALLLSHHVAMDATGLFNLAAHVLADYATVTTTGQPAPLPQTSFIDCLKFAREYRDSAHWTADRDYLVEYLRTATPALFDRRASVTPLAPVRRHASWLDRSLVLRLREQGVSFFPYLCAMVGTYLSRALRTDEVVVGIPLLNRSNPAEIAAVGGHFANTLPLRVDTGTHCSVKDLVNSLRCNVRQLKERQRFPLGDLVNEMRRGGHATGPLFDVTVNYVRLPGAGGLADILAEVEHMPQGASLLTLAINVHELDEAGPLRLVIDYATDIFDDDYPIESVERHLTALLRAGIDALEEVPSSIPMLSQAEYDSLTDQSWTTETRWENQSTVIGRIMEQARTSETVALLGHGAERSLTYPELTERVMRLVELLRNHGVAVGDHVAVLLERGPDMVVAIQAAMYAGAAYVPIDPGYPAERIQHILEDSAAKVVLTTSDRTVPVTGTSVISSAMWTTGPLTATPPAPKPTDLAYVIYTSGTTGKPKGVAVEHRSVINRLEWMQRSYPIGADDVILQKTPVSFDVSVWELFWWAIEGAKVALLAPGGEKDPREILRAIAEFQVTVLHFVPSMLTPFLDLLESAPANVQRVASLRLVFCSGEALRPHQVWRWNRAFASLGEAAPRLVNLYGPTEATVDVSAFDCPTDTDVEPKRIPIGKPIDNTRLYVLGAVGDPQPVGVPGELCIAGVGVARGYLNRPELNAEKFVPDPFHEGDRMYRTGDLARWLSDGQLEYLGRLDRQVKIRGNRVELGEVENALAGAPGITDAAVIDAEKATRGLYLHAFYVASDELDASALRKHLRQTLPDFMVPATFQRVERIPLTPSGKTDRAALRVDRSAVGRPVGPRTEVEGVLARVWAQVLEVESVSVEDNFFDLGGDSILMLRVRALAEAQGLVLSTRDIAAFPTVAQLAARVGVGADRAPVPVAPFELVADVDRGRLGHVQDAYPLTRLQLGMVFHSSQRADSPLYHDVFRYSLRMDWDQGAFGIAVGRLIARHPVLRTSFDLAGYSEPLQLVHPHCEAPLEIVDLRTTPADTDAADTADEVVAAHVWRHRHQPYQFDRPGLFHIGVFLLAGRIDVVLSFHHAILDGWSVAVIVAELIQDYRHFSGAPAPAVQTPALPSFAEHVRAEQLSLTDAADRQYWARLLADAPPVQIPGIRPHQRGTRAAAMDRVQQTRPMPADLVGAAHRMATEHHVPVKAVYLAAHLLTLSMLSAQRDVTSGVITHNRPERAHAERTAGLFLNTVPVRINTTDRTWAQVVHDVFDQERASTDHKLLPLFEIQRDLDVAVDVAFNYTNFHTAAATLATLDVELLDIDIHEDTNFTLLLNTIRNPITDTTTIRIDGDPTHYTPQQLDHIAHTYLHILTLITTTPTHPITYHTLTPTPTAPTVAPLSTNVIELFTAQASDHPDAIALEFGQRTVTYAELNDMAERIAAGLLARGIWPDDRVAIAVDRSPELVALVLGIAKAGAACVPLDVSYPPARLSTMLTQAGPAAVVTGPAYDSLAGDGWPRIDLASLLAAPLPEKLPVVRPEHTAYVLFTSGSTGTPKGVVMPNRSLANLVHWQLSTSSGWLTEAGRSPDTLQFAPVSFDVAFQEIYSTLCGGGRLVLTTEQERRDLAALVGMLDRARVERVFLPYVALQVLAEVAVNNAAVPSRLRIIVSSGERLRVTDDIRRLCAAIDGCVLENQYGPTETHVVTHYSMTGDPGEFPALPPIGTPIDNVVILVLDEQGRAVPDGVPGEIYIGGAALAHGYEGRPDLTDLAFQTHPVVPGLRLYRTGDIGRRLPDGALVTDGRSGTQVKVRGHRVETVEVELAVRQAITPLPGVSEVAVVARRSPDESSAGTQLVAFLTGDTAPEDRAGKEREILGTVRAVLPDYMVPSRVEWLGSMPITPSGKRADRLLATMPLNARDSEYVAPRDAQEAAVAEIVADVLRVAKVGALGEFSALGGDSLSALRLMLAVEQRFGISIAMSSFTTGPVVATLARRLRDRAVNAFDPCVPIKATGSRPPLFMVHPIGGSVLCYVELSKHLQPDQPLYGLQAAGIESGTVALRSISEMARSYVNAIRRVQPRGPYYIGGWSLGGIVAFEMARQLRAEGAGVASLVLLDSAAVCGGGVMSELPRETLYEAFMWELLRSRRGPVSVVEQVPGGSEDEALDFILARAVEDGVLPQGGSRELVRRLFDVFRGGIMAVDQYRPQALDVAVTLLRASNPLPDVLRPAHDHAGSLYGDATNGWARYATGTLRVTETPGDHLSMIEPPNAAVLATHITEVLAAAAHAWSLPTSSVA